MADAKSEYIMPKADFDRFNPSTDIPSLNGKVILITGANIGLGKATALSLAQHSPAHVFMAARDPTKGEAAVTEVRAVASPGTKVSFLHMDLSSFDSVKAAAKTCTGLEKRLDILYLNAGVLGHPSGTTQEGYETHIGVNHVGHALLLKLLTPTLEATASSFGTKPRIVSLASIGYKFLDPCTIRFADLKTPDSGIGSMQRYMQSKLANIVYARAFAKAHPQFIMVAVHPGEVETELYAREPGDDFVKHLQKDVAPSHWYGVDKGVKSQLWAGTVADEELKNGDYYEPVGEKGKAEKGALDEGLAKDLWEWTQKELEGHEI